MIVDDDKVRALVRRNAELESKLIRLELERERLLTKVAKAREGCAEIQTEMDYITSCLAKCAADCPFKKKDGKTRCDS